MKLQNLQLLTCLSFAFIDGSICFSNEWEKLF